MVKQVEHPLLSGLLYPGLQVGDRAAQQSHSAGEVLGEARAAGTHRAECQGRCSPPHCDTWQQHKAKRQHRAAFTAA